MSRASSASSTSQVIAQNVVFLVQRLLYYIAVILRLLLWPIVRLSYLIFPTNNLDGVSPQSAALAARDFVQHLSQIQRRQQQLSQHNSTSTATSQSNRNDRNNTDTNNDSLDELWHTQGFALAQQEASQREQLLLVYLYSPLQADIDALHARLWLNKDMQAFLRQQVTAVGLSIHSGSGAQLSQRLQTTAMPALLLLTPPPTASSRHWQLALKIQGSALTEMPIETLLQYAQYAYQSHQAVVMAARERRLVQQQSQELRQQQDAEYLETLRQDQEREQARLEAEQQAKATRQAKVDALTRARTKVRPAPATGGALVRFVLPSGTKLNRRFYSDDTIGVLHAFLMVHFHENKIGIERVALSTNFPRKTYTDEGLTLEDAGLTPQAVLMVQDLDA